MNGLVAFAVSALIAALLGGPLIARLKKLALAQHAYEDAPATHQTKTGTPTMGGVLFLPGVLTALVIEHDLITLALTILTLGCGLIGAVDDLASIRKMKNRGLSARAKFGATIVAAAVFLALVGFFNLAPIAHLSWPMVEIPLAVWIVLSLFVVLGTTHAVNLTDGLDGLAGGTMLPPLAVCAVLAIFHDMPSIATFDLALAGSIVGFLRYNRHPARVFMGDTGALALGGALAGSVILLGLQLLLPLLGGVFVAEALSVILQVASFKSTGRRIFRMSPLHHHFELGGARETQVTRGFWMASAVCAMLALVVMGQS